MKSVNFAIANDVKQLGVKSRAAILRGINNTQYHPDFEAYKENILEKAKQDWNDHAIDTDLVLLGFRQLHDRVSRSNKKYVASPEALIRLLIEHNRFPKINQVVDIYNLSSLRSKLALGAHDLRSIDGGVTLRFTTGNETFIPLGKNIVEQVLPEEYAHIDDNNEIICRLEVLQGNKTKISQNTTDIFLITQGNVYTDDAYILSILQTTCNLIRVYCGGTAEILDEVVQ
ncbi:B3/4 domain-containing protein [Candidatus Gottesmanbacteria bacterium]|nr:B3/4 domain-containing protein [Candidatus Gottesmanbacteria bacterium]